MSTRLKHIDQFCAGFAAGDAISMEALTLQSHLKNRGYNSAIYSEQFTEKDAGQVCSFRRYPNHKNSFLFLHFSFFSEIFKKLPSYRGGKGLIFHNITPASYVEPYNSEIAASLREAREELGRLREYFEINLAASEFNAALLRKLGYKDVKVLPLALDFSPPAPIGPLPDHLRYLKDGKTNILFVGRIFPNKRHQDLLKAFYYYRRINPNSRLIVVGPFHPGVRGYSAELHNLCSELKLKNDVIFTDMVSDADLFHYYDYSHLFLSMSDHEGFFAPLLESMFHKLPILAYSSTVVPETLGKSGVLFHEKDYPRIAELMEELTVEGPLRRQVIMRQSERLLDFSPDKSLSVFDETLENL